MTDPGGVLGEIVRRKRVDVAARLGSATLADLMGQATPTRLSLRAALAQPGARFIMEVKRASPSAGLLRPAADPAGIARAFSGAADAISVLVDEPFFGGSYRDLEAVRAVFTGPLLAKDFVVDPRQVPEARRHGADAVLIMLSVLDDSEARDVMAAAAALGMDALVEAHDEAEVRRAVALAAPLIGINNRDLTTLTVDLAVTERLAALVPADRTLVSESGIASRADTARLAPHVDAFLIGSALMSAPEPAAAARTLAFGRVKACGLTHAADAQQAAAAGATYAGIVFVTDTPRAVSLDQAPPIVSAAREGGAVPVGVFRNAPVEEVTQTATQLGLHAVQLHGSEDAAFIADLRSKLPQATEIWAANPIGDQIVTRPEADRLLFDTARNGRSGGTGQTFDWSLVADHPQLDRAFLAGGLRPGNAAAAARVGAYGLDVGSGIETSPGRKDAAKLAAFFEALRLPARNPNPCD